MSRVVPALLISTMLILATATGVQAHCQLPCGIYNDQMRIQMISEDIATIEKAMKEITALSEAKPANYNQLVRWINDKEAHANAIQEVVSQYFMTQRIKPDTEKYAEKLSTLHKMLIEAMKCKQTTDLENVNALKDSLKAFETLYFGHDH